MGTFGELYGYFLGGMRSEMSVTEKAKKYKFDCFRQQKQPQNDKVFCCS